MEQKQIDVVNLYTIILKSFNIRRKCDATSWEFPINYEQQFTLWTSTKCTDAVYNIKKKYRWKKQLIAYSDNIKKMSLAISN